MGSPGKWIGVLLLAAAAFAAGVFAGRGGPPTIEGPGGTRAALTPELYEKTVGDRDAALKKAESLAADIAAARKEASDAGRRAETAERRLDDLRAEIARAPAPAAPAASAPVEPPPAVAPVPSDPVEAALAETDWKRFCDALLLMTKQREGSGEGFNPEAAESFSDFLKTLARLSKAMGVKDPEKVFDDPRVLSAVVPNFLQAAGAVLSEAQFARIGQYVKTQAQQRQQQRAANPERTFLERVLDQGRDNLDFARYLQGELAADQVQAYFAATDSNPFFGLPVPENVLEAPAADELAAKVADAWKGSFRLDEPHLRELRQPANELVNRWLAADRATTGVYGLDPTGIPKMERLVRTLEVQVDVERSLPGRLNLTDEQKERVAKMSTQRMVLRISQ